jgi:release factor glutamine methyltransferase
METETIPEAPKILGTAKLLVSILITKFDRRESENLVRILVEEVIGKPYKWLLMNPEAIFSQKEINIWNAHAARLLQSEPLQYIIGKAWFAGLELKVAPGVLIPRPETEELVNWVIEVNRGNPAPKIVDVGTGSGCISLALSHFAPDSIVSGIDISEAALEIARENADKLNLKCIFLLCDVLNAPSDLFSGLDVVVSNPPYIPATEWASLDENVLRYEPERALSVPDADPLLYYIKVCALAKTWLRPGGWLLFEIHESFGAEMRLLLETNGFKDVEVRKDLSGRDRMAGGRWEG